MCLAACGGADSLYPQGVRTVQKGPLVGGLQFVMESGIVETWNRGNLETLNHGDKKTRNHGDMEIWRYGEIEKLRNEIWKH